MAQGNILVTGACGTIGREVLALLAAQAGRFRVTAFDRPGRQARKLQRRFRNIRFLYGDITDPVAVAAACRDQDVIIHLAGLIPPLADQLPELAQRVNLGGTQTLIAAATRQAPNAFLLFSSSIAVYGDRLHRPDIRVDDALAASPGDHYGASKIDAEAAIRSSALDWSIFRLTAIMGAHRVSPLMFHVPLDTAFEISIPTDAARAFVNAIDQRATLSRRIFNLGGGADCRLLYRDMLDRSFLAMGLGRADLPETAFARKNFHCGNYLDGDELEAILGFRSVTLDRYFTALAEGQPRWRRSAAGLLQRPIKRYLLAKSEPYRAMQRQDEIAMARFF